MKSPLLRIKGSIAILIFTCCSLALFAGIAPFKSSSPSPAVAAEGSNPVISLAGKRTRASSFFAAAGDASIRTSKSNYEPGDTAKISGDGFQPGELVTLQVVHVNGPSEPGAGHQPWTVSADQNGYLSSTWYVDPDDSAGATFLLTANGVLGSSASFTFTDAANASADLDQCRNGSSASPAPCTGDGSGGSGWVNGNVGAQQGHYIEGYVIPYRMRMSNMAAGSWTLDIGYDTVHSGAHAIDFLTHYDLIGGTSAAPTVPDHTLVFNHTAECIDPSDSWIGLPGNAKPAVEDGAAGKADTFRHRVMTTTVFPRNR